MLMKMALGQSGSGPSVPSQRCPIRVNLSVLLDLLPTPTGTGASWRAGQITEAPAVRCQRVVFSAPPTPFAAERWEFLAVKSQTADGTGCEGRVKAGWWLGHRTFGDGSGLRAGLASPPHALRIPAAGAPSPGSARGAGGCAGRTYRFSPRQTRGAKTTSGRSWQTSPPARLGIAGSNFKSVTQSGKNQAKLQVDLRILGTGARVYLYTPPTCVCVWSTVYFQTRCKLILCISSLVSINSLRKAATGSFRFYKIRSTHATLGRKPNSKRISKVCVEAPRGDFPPAGGQPALLMLPSARVLPAGCAPRRTFSSS